MFGAAYTFKRNEHVRVGDFLPVPFPSADSIGSI